MIQEFPDDENGNVLREMKESGDDLSRPRFVDFTVVFPNEAGAKQLAGRFEKRGCTVAVKRSGVIPELPWDVTVSRFMVPAHGAISEFENELASASASLGGRNDGWGCFERNDEDH